MNAKKKLKLLNGLSPQEFMRDYWQKKHLMIRRAKADFKSPIDRLTLFDLAGNQDVESRLVSHTGKAGIAKWTVRTGPFKRRSLPQLNRPNWTLLVQGVDLHSQQARNLLDEFRFVPDARLDDLMVSYASKGGGVGPHFDNYDVFLLQAEGRRRWQIGSNKNHELREDVPLKMLANFEPQEEFVLEPGDMLYLPPQMSHNGISLDDSCITCSIGFRAASSREITHALLSRLGDLVLDEGMDSMYKDPKQRATSSPARLPEGIVDFAQLAIGKAVGKKNGLTRVLGEYLTDPKPNVWFEPGAPRSNKPLVVLDKKTKILYSDHFVFVNGESFRASGLDGKIIRRLADMRRISAEDLENLSVQALSLLDEWLAAGWMHPE